MQASTDQATMDVMLPLIFGSVLAVLFSAVGILVVVIQVTWQILILIVPLAFVYISYQVRIFLRNMWRHHTYMCTYTHPMLQAVKVGQSYFGKMKYN